MREGFASHHAGIIDEKLDGEIVGGINDEVIVADDVQCVGRIEKLSIGLHLHIGIDGLNLLLGALYLGHTQIFGEMDNLPLQIAQVHHIGIHHSDSAYTGRREIERDRRTESAGTHHQHARIHNLLLAFHTHILEQDMTGITLYLLFREVNHRAPPPIK